MSSQKLLNQRTVLQLFSKSLNGRGPQICHICGLASCLSVKASILHNNIGRGNNNSHGSIKNNQRQNQQHQARLSYRPSSSSSASLRAASVTASLAPALHQTGSNTLINLTHQQDSISSHASSSPSRNVMHRRSFSQIHHRQDQEHLATSCKETATIFHNNNIKCNDVNNNNNHINNYDLLANQHRARSMLINNNNCNSVNFQQFRCSSTTSATNQLAQEILVRRDASTQARQQVKLNPNEHIYENEDDDQQQDLHRRRRLHEFEMPSDTFRCDEMKIIKCTPSEMAPKPPVESLMFGKCFTDHMFRVDWDQEMGWQRPVISKVHDLNLHPAAKVFHYGLGAFEGAKAYRGHDDKIRFFRLDQNIKRLVQSTRRLALPEFDIEEMIKCIHKLVELDQDWIPQVDQKAPTKQLTSLYLRPMIMGVEPSLGVACSKKAILSVLLSPVGPYFKTGFKPVSLYADPDVVRAWPGGAGSSKLGSNYAPTIFPQRQAEKLGHQQVLWLFGEDEKLTEVGTMNIFVTIKNESTGKTHLVTPPLDDGLILPGITRQSILEMASEWSDIVCEERYLTIGDIQELIANNQLLEMFGSGTACIVCPISSINLKDGRQVTIPSHNLEESSPAHAITQRILTKITDIQYGRIPHPWAQELGSLRY